MVEVDISEGVEVLFTAHPLSDEDHFRRKVRTMRLR